MRYIINWKRSSRSVINNEMRLRGMLGFAMRAGKLIIGTESVCRAMAKGTPKLVVISKTASDATRKKLTVKSDFYGIPYKELPLEAEELGRLIGKTFAPMALAVTDEGFAAEISKAADPATTL